MTQRTVYGTVKNLASISQVELLTLDGNDVLNNLQITGDTWSVVFDDTGYTYPIDVVVKLEGATVVNDSFDISENVQTTGSCTTVFDNTTSEAGFNFNSGTFTGLSGPVTITLPWVACGGGRAPDTGVVPLTSSVGSVAFVSSNGLTNTYTYTPPSASGPHSPVFTWGNVADPTPATRTITINVGTAATNMDCPATSATLDFNGGTLTDLQPGEQVSVSIDITPDDSNYIPLTVSGGGTLVEDVQQSFTVFHNTASQSSFVFNGGDYGQTTPLVAGSVVDISLDVLNPDGVTRFTGTVIPLEANGAAVTFDGSTPPDPENRFKFTIPSSSTSLVFQWGATAEPEGPATITIPIVVAASTGFDLNTVVNPTFNITDISGGNNSTSNSNLNLPDYPGVPAFSANDVYFTAPKYNGSIRRTDNPTVNFATMPFGLNGGDIGTFFWDPVSDNHMWGIRHGTDQLIRVDINNPGDLSDVRFDNNGTSIFISGGEATIDDAGTRCILNTSSQIIVLNIANNPATELARYSRPGSYDRGGVSPLGDYYHTVRSGVNTNILPMSGNYQTIAHTSTNRNHSDWAIDTDDEQYVCIVGNPMIKFRASDGNTSNLSANAGYGHFARGPKGWVFFSLDLGGSYLNQVGCMKLSGTIDNAADRILFTGLPAHDFDSRGTVAVHQMKVNPSRNGQFCLVTITNVGFGPRCYLVEIVSN